MTDVRLTATNPADSSVVPVACNAKGELLLEEPQIQSDLYVTKAGDTMSGALHLGDEIELLPGDTPTVKVQKESDSITLAPAGSGDIELRNYETPGSTAGITWVQRNGADTSWRYSRLSVDPDIGFEFFARNTAFDGSETPRITFGRTGTASFASDVIVGSRNKAWMIVESNGLAHLVEQVDFAVKEQTNYPQLRNIPDELTMVEQQLQKVMERLKMAPQAGWEVWDGSE